MSQLAEPLAAVLRVARDLQVGCAKLDRFENERGGWVEYLDLWFITDEQLAAAAERLGVELREVTMNDVAWRAGRLEVRDGDLRTVVVLRGPNMQIIPIPVLETEVEVAS